MPGDATDPVRPPIWSLLSVTMPAVASLVGAIAVVVSQAVMDNPSGVSRNDFHQLSRTGVIAMLACIATGFGAGLLGIAVREQPWRVALLGLLTSAVLICLFWYFGFYVLNFDQDRGAGRQ
jgi:uncharacterized BrkB/YihY/UPF0761 family membrane protein